MLYPKVASNNEDKVLIKFSELGKYKRRSWEFQKECRFVITIIPVSYKELSNSPDAAVLLERLVANVDLDIDSYFLPIKEDCFNKMSITLGPNITDEDRVKVELLVAELNPKAIIENSILTGRIKNK